MFYTRKAKGIHVMEAWFQMPEVEIKNKYWIRSYKNMSASVLLEKGEYLVDRRDAWTLVSNLNLSEEDLLLCCDRNVRNEIRRAKKDGILSAQYASGELVNKEDLLRDFDAAYAAMHQSKGLKVVSVYEYMKQLARESVLNISLCKMEEDIIAYHVYVVGDGIARLLYSVSVFRGEEDSARRAAIGRGNRMLHYEDMLWFKDRGFHTYDWGGYSMDPSLASINAFKKGFGGTEQPRYYATTTTKKWLKKALDMRARRNQR